MSDYETRFGGIARLYGRPGLEKLRAARDAARDQSGGTALVPVKRSILDEEMEQLGLSLRSVQAPRRRVIGDAYGAGKEAGEKFEYRAGIVAE